MCIIKILARRSFYDREQTGTTFVQPVYCNEQVEGRVCDLQKHVVLVTTPCIEYNNNSELNIIN